jgi:hypothetical protein
VARVQVGAGPGSGGGWIAGGRGRCLAEFTGRAFSVTFSELDHVAPLEFTGRACSVTFSELE